MGTVLDFDTMIRRTVLDRNIVLAHGCFDVLSYAHVRHLKAAKDMGTTLLVTITPDRFVNKAGRPLFGQDVRAEVIAALECVDYAAVSKWPTACEAILEIRPRVFVKGGEYRDHLTSALMMEKNTVESVGGRLAFTAGAEYHTSELLAMMKG